MRRHVATRIATGAVVAAAGAAAWLTLAPTQLGGRTSYVIIQGSSMEPALSAGDLAVVRSGTRIVVGDEVLYHDPELGVDVLHGIVREERGAFVLKGDSNDFLDDTRPTRREIQGELWFSVPLLGTAILWGRRPLHAAILVFLLTLFTCAGGARRTTHATQPEA